MCQAAKAIALWAQIFGLKIRAALSLAARRAPRLVGGVVATHTRQPPPRIASRVCLCAGAPIPASREGVVWKRRTKAGGWLTFDALAAIYYLWGFIYDRWHYQSLTVPFVVSHDVESKV